jgi:hypothetical protein
LRSGYGTESLFLTLVFWDRKGCVIVPGTFAREAAATLLRFAKTTSDPKVSAALINKAADLNERAEDLSPSKRDLSTAPPDVQKEQ